MTDNLNQKQNKTIGQKLQEIALELVKQYQPKLGLLSTVDSLETGSPQHQNFAQTIMQQSQPEKLLTIAPFRRQSIPEMTRQEPFFAIEGDNFWQRAQTQFLQAHGEQQQPNQAEKLPQKTALKSVVTLPIPVTKQDKIKPNLTSKPSSIDPLGENAPGAAQKTPLDLENSRWQHSPGVTRIEQQKQFVENIEQQRLVKQIEQSSYSLLDNQIKDFLGKLLKLRLPQTVKIYHNSASDYFAQKLNADAITYEDKILFRTGKYQLKQLENIALLGHELTHINQEFTQQNNNIDPRSEQLAISNEQTIINYLASPAPLQSLPLEQRPIRPSRPSNNAFASLETTSSVPVPQTAPSSRSLNTPSQINNPNGKSSGELSPQQIKIIKEEVYRELIQRIRTEFERGG